MKLLDQCLHLAMLSKVYLHFISLLNIIMLGYLSP